MIENITEEVVKKAAIVNFRPHKTASIAPIKNQSPNIISPKEFDMKLGIFCEINLFVLMNGDLTFNKQDNHASE